MPLEQIRNDPQTGDAVVPPRAHRRAYLPIVIAAMAFCLGRDVLLISKPIDTVDVNLLTDDSYITFHIARQIALGRGAIGDSVHETSGFQPLYVVLLAGASWLSGITDREGFFRLAMFISVIIHVAGVPLMARLGERLGGWKVGAAVAVVWVLSVTVTRYSLNGMETGLALLALVLLTLAALKLMRAPGWRSAVLFGLAAGAAVWSRVDLALAAGCLGLGVLFSQWPQWRAALTRLIAAAGVALLIILPLMLWNYHICGSPTPQSGFVCRAWARQMPQWQHNITSMLDRSGRWAGTAVSRHLLLSGVDVMAGKRAQAAIGLLAIGVAAVIFLIALPRRRILHGRSLPEWWGLGLFLLALAVFYGVYFRVFWYTTRYLTPIAVASTLLAGWLLVKLLDAASGRIGLRNGMAGVAVLTAGYFLPGNALLLARGSGSNDGYGQLGRFAASNLPAGMRVGAFQTGALSYYAPASVTIINLDGKVNFNAYRALSQRRLDAYLRDQNIDVIIDWPAVPDVLRYYGPSRQISIEKATVFGAPITSWESPWYMYQLRRQTPDRYG